MTTKKPKGLQPGKFDGVGAAAEMLRGLDETSRARILKEVAERDPAKAGELRGRMFLFSDLATLEEVALQTLMKSVPQEILVLALRNVTEELREKLLGAVSTRLRGTLRAEIVGQGPKPVGKVRAAQEKVVDFARQLGLVR